MIIIVKLCLSHARARHFFHASTSSLDGEVETRWPLYSLTMRIIKFFLLYPCVKSREFRQQKLGRDIIDTETRSQGGENSARSRACHPGDDIAKPSEVPVNKNRAGIAWVDIMCLIEFDVERFQRSSAGERP